MKILGKNFFETHTQLQKMKEIDSDHVIVDRKDYEQILNFFYDRPVLIEQIGKPLHLVDNC